ncbi:uncharacterized protein [Henckelia pumila]|uniref:uncharacterized protein n=1 Tax=Henckelia pumila TaxID=405737 RepID=UPI003C6E4FD3
MAARLDIHDPLYLVQSDTPGLSLISEQLTGSENYNIWSRAMLICLRAKNKIAFIDGSYQRPEAGSATLPAWERCNALVLSWILNSVSKEIFGGIVYSSDAFTVWNDLKERFNRVNGSRIFSILRELNRLVQGNVTVTSYYSKLKQLWDEYSSFVALPTCECESVKTYIEHDQQHKLLQFLMGLNDSFAHVRSQILLMDPLPTVGQAYALISQEESHRSLMVPPSSLSDLGTSAFYSAQNKPEVRKKEPLYCVYCNWPGHTKATCFKLVGYPPGHRFYKGSGKGQNYTHPRMVQSNQNLLAMLTCLAMMLLKQTNRDHIFLLLECSLLNNMLLY